MTLSGQQKMSKSSGKTPVVIGVGDIINRSKKVENAIEPLQLMLQAIKEALKDTGLPASQLAALQSSIDSVDVVAPWTWPADYPALVAERLECKPVWTFQSGHAGSSPGFLFDEAARRISKGETKVAVVTGGEALASLTACAAAKKIPPPGWVKPNKDVDSVFSPTTRDLAKNVGGRHAIGKPVQLYPLYENAFRAYRNQSQQDNHRESAELYAEFAKVAEKHPYAWNYGKPAETVESIATVTKRNRMICHPYPLLMNAFNTVNLSAACILTTSEHARELDISPEKFIYPLGGAGTADSYDFWERPAYWWGPNVSRSLDAGLKASGLDKDEIDLYDFYSCFPIVPKLALHHLGMPIVGKRKPITLLGGLTSFGGAGNNYSLHAITEMTRQLRQRKGKKGLILANGGSLTSEHVVCLSASPRKDGLPYPSSAPLPKLVTDVYVPPLAEQPEGDATIETYTVDYDRDNKPELAFIVGRLKNGNRFLANHADEHTLKELSSIEREQINRTGKVWPGKDGRNLFSFGEVARL